MVVGNRLASLLPLAGCCIIGVVGLAIATVIICSLIPLYLNYRAVSRSAYSVRPYSLSNVDFARYYNGKRNARMVRSTQSVIPTAVTIQSFEDELNTLFASIGAKCVVTTLSMSSNYDVSLNLAVYFVKAPVTSHKAQLHLIQKVLASGKTIQVNLQFHTSCYSNAINAGPTPYQSQTSANTFTGVPTPSDTLLASLAQAVDECQSVTSQESCESISAQQFNSEIQSSTSQGYTYYCFYWTPTTSLNDISINFAFQNTANQVYLDDITFNSTMNLIEDGGFETNYIPAAWDCNGNCSKYIVEGYGHTGVYSFSSPGGVPLQQTVTIPANDNIQTYQFGFWLAFSCNQTNPCAVTVTATEEVAVTTQITTQGSSTTIVAVTA